MPGCLIAMGRLNRPALMVYGGTIKPGCTAAGATLDVVSAFQSYGEFLAGRITRDEAPRHRAPQLPRRGRVRRHVHGQHHGLAPSRPGHEPALQLVDPGRRPAEKRPSAARGRAIRLLLERDIKPRDIMTRAAFENAMVVVMVLGGSTNAVLHLIAMARAVDVPLTSTTSRPSATACRSWRLKPSGRTSWRTCTPSAARRP
jgi:dihydroxy-acid dehydratase